MNQQTNHSLQYILIAEDSAVDYEITTRSLRKAGIDNPIYHCENGDDVLVLLTEPDNDVREEKGYPCLILLDLNMPGTDGRDILEQIKNHDEAKKIPVIVLTTSNNEKDIAACYEKGANSYVQKPTSPDDFIEMAKSFKKFWLDWAVLPDGNF